MPMDTVQQKDYAGMDKVLSILNNTEVLQQQAAVRIYNQQVKDLQTLLDLRMAAEQKVAEEKNRLNLVTSEKERAEREKELKKAISLVESRYKAEEKQELELNQRKYNIKKAELMKSGMDEREAAQLALNYKLELDAKVRAKTKQAIAEETEDKKKSLKEIQALTQAQMDENAVHEAELRAAAEAEAQRDAEKEKKKKDRADKKRKREEKQNNDKQIISNVSDSLYGKNFSITNLKDALGSAKDEYGTKGAIGAMTGAIVGGLSSLAQKLGNKIDEAGAPRSGIDTRLYGSKNKTKGREKSYYDYISNDIVGVAGVSPLVKQADIIKNVQTMVDQGIAFDIEQRAFLQTIKDKIATTFDATDGTLRRLIRIQQQDSTAARLGMEAALNAFLNNMYETTEYLKDVASSVRSSLEEAQALMNAAQASEVQFVTEKWLGSMYSVGVSQSGITSIANALGKLAAGDISGITDGGTGNLIVMAANEAGLSIADMLKNGLDAPKTNSILNAIVKYLNKIYINAQDSKVVQQQIAKVYGLTASDLKALTNISSDANEIASVKFAYSDMLQQLQTMAGSMYSRTSMGERMDNVFENLQYTMAAGIANSPALYGIYKFAGLLDTVVGGIPLPFINTFFGGIDLHTTVADLMRVAALSGSFLKGVGQMTLANKGGGFSGTKMLSALEITGNNVVARGKKSNIQGTGSYTVSESGAMTAGNEDGNAVQDKTLADAADDKKKQQAEADKENEGKGDPVTDKNLKESLEKVVNPKLEPIAKIGETLSKLTAALTAAPTADSPQIRILTAVYMAEASIRGLYPLLGYEAKSISAQDIAKLTASLLTNTAQGTGAINVVSSLKEATEANNANIVGTLSNISALLSDNFTKDDNETGILKTLSNINNYLTKDLTGYLAALNTTSILNTGLNISYLSNLTAVEDTLVQGAMASINKATEIVSSETTAATVQMATLTNFINAAAMKSHLASTGEDNSQTQNNTEQQNQNWLAIQGEEAPKTTSYMANIDSTLASIYKVLTTEGIVIKNDSNASPSPELQGNPFPIAQIGG